MKDFLHLISIVNKASLHLLLVPVVSWVYATSLAEAYEDWYWKHIVKEIL